MNTPGIGLQAPVPAPPGVMLPPPPPPPPHPPVGGASAVTAASSATAAAATATPAGEEKKTGEAATDGENGKASSRVPPVPVTAVAMKLLDMRLRHSSAVICSVLGDFTLAAVTSKTQQLVLVRTGGVIELYSIVGGGGGGGSGSNNINNNNNTLKLEHRLETRSIVRTAVTVRLTGEKRDLLAVGSDSGSVTVLDWDRLSVSGGASSSTAAAAATVVVAFGKTGCRRAVPGQYLAADPKGRAIMVGAVEKRKLVYVLNHRQGGGEGGSNSNSNSSVQQQRLALGSPLEAHRSRTVCYAMVGVDNGYDNPIFACLEVQYPDHEEEGGTTAAAAVASSSSSATTTSPSQPQPRPAKQLAYYELDLGLNHVSRKWAVTVPSSACCLVALPGTADGGPSGVLVGMEHAIQWYGLDNNNMNMGGGMGGSGSSSTSSTTNTVTCLLPRRAWQSPASSPKGSLVTCMTVHKQKRGKFFALIQTEVGDVFKASMDVVGGASDTATSASTPAIPTVTSIKVELLDSLPPANALNVSKKGLLFAASEFGDHGLYQFERIDFGDNTPRYSSSTDGVVTTATLNNNNNNDGGIMDDVLSNVPTFTPHGRLQNLVRVAALDNPSPTTGILVGELAGNEVSPQVYTLAGRGPSSSLRILRHGCSVTELAVSDLPGVPGGIFTVDDEVLVEDDEGEGGDLGGEGGGRQGAPPRRVTRSKYIVVSFADATLVLSVGDTVEEVGRESGFLTNAPTLACSALRGGGGDGTSSSYLQVHPSGVRHIQRGQAKQWHCPGLKRIECASANTSQVLIALAGGEVIYFELDALSGNLTESATRSMRADVCCLDVGVVPSGSGAARSLFCAVGCRDSTVQIVSLEPGAANLLKTLSTTTLKSRPNSVKLLQPARANEDLVLMMGLDDGSCMRATVDPVTGAIGTSPTRRFLGARPVTVARIPLEGKTSLMLLSSRPWISRHDGSGSGKHVMAPLSYAPLDHGCAFSSEAVPEGVVATAGKTLRIISVDTAGMEGGEDEAFNTNRVALRYTPRQMTLLAATTTAAGSGDPDGGSAAAAAAQAQRKVVLAIVESDYNDYGLEEKTAMGFSPDGGGGQKQSKSKEQDDDAMDEDSDEEDDAKKGDDEVDDEDDEDVASRATPLRGPIPPEPGHWGSCVRLLDPADSCRTLECIEMGRNEAALCCASVRFHTRGGESLLAVGTVTGMSLHPLKQSSSHVILYRVINGERLQLLHKTDVEDGPVLALAHFQGRLLVGIGRTLRLYEMGKRQLLRKCELRGLPTYVKTLQTAGDRCVYRHRPCWTFRRPTFPFRLSSCSLGLSFFFFFALGRILEI